MYQTESEQFAEALDRFMNRAGIGVVVFAILYFGYHVCVWAWR